MKESNDSLSSRRNFLGTLALGTAGMVAAAQNSFANVNESVAGGVGDAEAWLKKIKGKHKILYDATEPYGGFPIIWSWVFYQTNNQTGTPDTDMTALVVLRHGAIPMAMKDDLWTKYKFGEMFKVTDNNTNAPALRNPFYEPQGKDFPMATIQGMKALQGRGVMFCVCDMALTVYSMFAAQAMGAKPEDVKAEWVSGLHPDIQIVPSGVWAVGRGQEKGCAYCYAGG